MIANNNAKLAVAFLHMLNTEGEHLRPAGFSPLQASRQSVVLIHWLPIPVKLERENDHIWQTVPENFFEKSSADTQRPKI